VSGRTEHHGEAGRFAAEILRSRVWTDQAAAMHAEVAREVTRAGFDVEFEVWAPFADYGRAGRIDLLAGHGRGLVAIELDARRPRLGSIRKLLTFQAYRIIGLRGVELEHEIFGIDEVVGMNVRCPSLAQATEKRSVNRFAA